MRGIYNTLPFKYMPAVFAIEMVYACVFWRDMFALRGGISDTQSPSAIVLNQPVVTMCKQMKKMMTAWKHVLWVPLSHISLETFKGLLFDKS